MLALRATPFVLAALGGACLDAKSPGGPKLNIGIAPLTLIGPDNVCYDLLVENAAGTVWSRGDRLLTRLGADQTGGTTTGDPDLDTVCSDRFGNAAGGGITYIGTCDATSDADANRTGVQNRVTLWVDGIYKSGADIGGWQDPCPDGCSLSIDCNANEDSLVEFNLTIMRQANQGFFDIAVNFQDIFCSAKFDTCYPDGDDDDLADDPIKLIHGADQTRDWTGVFGFACTAGSESTATNLLYGPIAVTCGANVFVIDPTVAEGNASVAGSTGGVLHYGVYRGTEQLDCGTGAGSCKKLYWNVAFSIEDLEALGGSCSLALTATANDDNQGFALGLPTAVGGSYPYIDVATTLTDNGAGICQRHPLNATDSAVRTQYRGNMVGATPPSTMCSQFNGVTVGDTGATEGCGHQGGGGECHPSCATCSGPGVDECTSCEYPARNDWYENEGPCLTCDGPGAVLRFDNVCACGDNLYGNPWTTGCLPCHSDCASVVCSGPTIEECCHESCVHSGNGCSGPLEAQCHDSLWCDDGIQNFDETGIDCGGTGCSTCPPSCNDGIRNGTETGTDCGGVSSGVTCPACPVDDCVTMSMQSDQPNPSGWSMPADATDCFFDLVNLPDADLTGADFSGAFLNEMDLSGAILVGANLNAHLRLVNFAGADLTGAIMNGVLLDENNTWIGATCPDQTIVDGVTVTSCLPNHILP